MYLRKSAPLRRSRPAGTAELYDHVRTYITAKKLAKYPRALEVMPWMNDCTRFYELAEAVTLAHPTSRRLGWPVNRTWQRVAEEWVDDCLRRDYGRHLRAAGRCDQICSTSGADGQSGMDDLTNGQ